MRSVSPLIAASLALALASPVLAQATGSTMSSGGGAVPPTAPTTSQPPATTDTNPPAQAPAPPSQPSTPPTASEPASPSQQSAPSAQGSGAPASATAQSSAPASYTVGESVKDNTGTAIGSITSLTGAGANQMAVIKMGDQSFQVQTSRLGSADGAAEINMTKAQIAAMLHSPSK
jgi:hypothetical protein